MTDEEILKLVLAAAGERNGRKVLPCAEAFRLAQEHSLNLLDIARVCNLNNVKFVDCQLGCFK